MRNLKSTSQFTVDPLRAELPFGAIVRDLDPDALHDERVREDLRTLWIEEGLIVFKGLSGSETHITLSEVFGPGIEHPAKEVRKEYPGLVDVTYDPSDGFVVEVDGEPRGKPYPWHSDLIYAEQVNHGGILRPITLPSRWGETGFIDQIWAYERLPNALKRRIDGLHVVYKYNLDAERQRFGVANQMRVLQYSPQIASIQSRLDDFPPVVHPLVFTQKQTGRKVLNLSPWFSTGIEELPGAEGDALLDEIAAILVDPVNSYLHEWHMDEMVLWDNWRMLHSALGTPIDERRHMMRTTIAGDYGLGRRAEGAQAKSQSEYLVV